MPATAAHYTDDQFAIFQAGAQEARRFHHGAHLIHQDLFKAETPNHRIYIGYDDVEDGVYGSVIFKNRWDADGNQRRVELHFRNAAQAIARMARFLTQNPVPEPRCSVDY